MANYYLDFVGLNTFIYEPVGYDPDNQIISSLGLAGSEEIQTVNGVRTRNVAQNILGISSGQVGLNNYKNARFPYDLPNTASFFPALMLKRNGPYGFPTFKQIRISHNPLTRKQIKNNVFTYVEEPGPEVVISGRVGDNTIRSKYGSILSFIENPVSSRYKPFLVGGSALVDSGDLERFELQASYGNETIFFNNEKINKYNNLRLQRSKQYEIIKDFYLNDALNQDGSPFETFEFFKYRECIYPPRIYQYKNYVRQRTTFSFPWRDARIDRIEEKDDNGFGSPTTQSMWVLDAHSNWGSPTSTGTRWNVEYGYRHNKVASYGDYGILQNNYTIGTFNFDSLLSFSSMDTFVRPAPIYNRKHLQTFSSSVVSPNGMKIEGINFGTSMGNLLFAVGSGDSESGNGVPGGEAAWEAGSQSGLNPFYDTYENYIQGPRQLGKDYSIIPEFRISEHVETYQSKGFSEELTNIFSLTGALSNTTDSSKTNFYKIYSTSEFMKHFELVRQDHKDFVPPNSLTLKCKAIKKLLPYDGFYPAQRSVQLAEQFYSSYSPFIAKSGSLNGFNDAQTSVALDQLLLIPTFAPGIFFNTIKSGVAVDYPLIDRVIKEDNSYVSKADGDYYLVATKANLFDRRIPFEALVEPEKHLAGTPIFSNEPHPFANMSGSVSWSGDGNNLYKLMAHNFLAETAEFFMKGKTFTSISSKPSNNPNVGKAEKGKKYMMRVKMFKSKETATTPQVSGSSGFFTPPQYASGTIESFTMYSRPSAFGPPLRAALSTAAQTADLSRQGENYAYTPPYYYGQGWADITFTPTESRKYSISEIISGSVIRHWRYADASTTKKENTGHWINGGPAQEDSHGHQMRLEASVNLLSQTNAVLQLARGADALPVVTETNDPPSRWVIQTKFETPMLNFNHLSASNSITLPTAASQSVPRGMWHQYGRVEEDPTKGIFLQVDSVPKAWITEWLEQDASTVESLADLCGFSTEAVRLGEISPTKKLYEAVVAVPFIEEEGERKFFRIPRIDIQRAQGTGDEKRLVGKSIKSMITRMKRYVFPPSMDFLSNESVDPFAMYIFEFTHTLDKQDLANIWQNLYPKIGREFQTSEASITHELLSHELLGGGAIVTPDGKLDINAVGNEIPDRVKWMVFKVKKRARINYYSKIIGRSDELAEATVTSEGVKVDVSFNWPYDFFSLVELAKIESEVKFAERLEKEGEEPRETVKAKTSDRVSSGRGRGRGEAGFGGGRGGLNEELGRVRVQNVAKAKQAATRALGDGSRGDVVSRNRQGLRNSRNEFGRTPDEAAERAAMKARGELGRGKYLYTNPDGDTQQGFAANTDYDGDGKRDPEDGGYE